MNIGVGLDEWCEFPRSIKVQTKANVIHDHSQINALKTEKKTNNCFTLSRSSQEITSHENPSKL